MTLSRLALTLALLPTLPALAETPSQDDALKLDELLVTANRSVEARSQSSAASTVFTRADIERLQASDVLDLLRHAPGVSIARNGGPGSLSGLFMRGTSSAQTLVLVDGVRISSASSGTSALENLNLNQIERVEVVRGGRSALYGADAIGGVVQIFTRRGDAGLTPRLHFGIGSHGTFERSLGIAGGDEETRFDLSASLGETVGTQRTDLPGSDDSAYRNRAFSLSLSHRFSDTLNGGISLLRQSGQSEYDNSDYPTTPADTDFELSSGSAFLEAEMNDQWSGRVELGHAEDRQTSHASYGNSVYNTYRDQASWVNQFELTDAQRLQLGADWYEDRLNSDNAFIKDSRWNHGFFVLHRIETGSFSTELGARYDDNQAYGSHTSWNGAFTYHLNPDNDLIASYSEAFRAPTFNDLYDPFGGGNLDLDPEKARSFELQWRSQLAKATRLELSLYRTTIDDAIVGYPPMNIDKARIHGFEASLAQDFFGWQAQASFTLVDARNASSGSSAGNRLPRRPENSFKLDLDRRFGDYSVGASWQLIGHTWNDVANDQEIAGYGLLDLRSAWQARPDLRFDLKIDNLLDHNYYQTLGTAYDASFTSVPYRYEELGRTALLGMTWTPAL
ncbi:TonB-dependent receptor [Pseudomonas sp. PS02288]|uniref:TonB-dependent receptor domain-containing protein n=1 Tax=Pseudomonas sp. PS02288 TaxID=2991443 RepID=UPI00249BB397|nr:TonB-dependent receptor [Pseudomonas sp. PS02288]